MTFDPLRVWLIHVNFYKIHTKYSSHLYTEFERNHPCYLYTCDFWLPKVLWYKSNSVKYSKDTQRAYESNLNENTRVICIWFLSSNNPSKGKTIKIKIIMIWPRDMSIHTKFEENRPSRPAGIVTAGRQTDGHGTEINTSWTSSDT